jgi:hypothetical protein
LIQCLAQRLGGGDRLARSRRPILIVSAARDRVVAGRAVSIASPHLRVEYPVAATKVSF